MHTMIWFNLQLFKGLVNIDSEWGHLSKLLERRIKQIYGDYAERCKKWIFRLMGDWKQTENWLWSRNSNLPSEIPIIAVDDAVPQDHIPATMRIFLGLPHQYDPQPLPYASQQSYSMPAMIIPPSNVKAAELHTVYGLHPPDSCDALQI